MRVRIIDGVSQITCLCGSWLQHWLNFSQLPLPAYCAELRCLQQPTVGALVRMEPDSAGRWYVVPLCYGHSALTGESIEISWSAVPVPANPTETCSRGLPGHKAWARKGSKPL